MRIIFHPHGNSVLSRRPVSPFATYDKSVRIGLKAILPLRIESGTKPGRHTMTNRLFSRIIASFAYAHFDKLLNKTGDISNGCVLVYIILFL